MRIFTFAVCLVVLSMAPAFGAPLFTGPFDAANWTFSTDGNGTLDASNLPDSIRLTGSDGSLCDPCVDIATTYTLNYTGPANGAFAFRWIFETFDTDGPAFDPFGFRVNGNYVQLTNDSGPDAQSGYVALVLQTGDTVAFSIVSTDDDFGPSEVTIEEVPEPRNLVLFGAGLALVLAARRRRV